MQEKAQKLFISPGWVQEKFAKWWSITVCYRPPGIQSFPLFSVRFPQICWVALLATLSVSISAGTAVRLVRFSLSAHQPSTCGAGYESSGILVSRRQRTPAQLHLGKCV